jgi:NAD(P)-dependent dehydrogenase (short-subunit alcohol dehydrogenase family)
VITWSALMPFVMKVGKGQVVDAAMVEGAALLTTPIDGLRHVGMWNDEPGTNFLAGFERIIEINLLGTIRVLRLAGAQMASQDPLEDGGRGVCVNTASIAAFDGQIGQVAYAASKGGIVGLTLPAARDLAQHGVRVVTIAPGIFDTPLLGTLPSEVRDSLGKSVPFPPRLGSPEEFAALVDHIVANGMLNGEVIRLDGALRMAPR